MLVALFVVSGSFTSAHLISRHLGSPRSSASAEQSTMPGAGGSSPSSPLSPSPIPTATPTAAPTATPTATPTLTAQPTANPTVRPSAKPTPRPKPVPTAKPSAKPAQPSGGLPACRYDDILTARRSYGSWATTLLDTIFMLPSGYYPGDLVDTATGSITAGYTMRSLVATDMRALTDAARAAGIRIGLVSAFRSYKQQQSTFNHWVSVAGHEAALRTSARPGHSEHQLGTAFDFSTPGLKAPWEYADWATTTTGAWLKANAHRYGFVMSYPKGKASVSCYDYEPWHYRYVGRNLAAEIVASGLTPREFLWRIDH